MADEIIIETTSAEVIEVAVPGAQGPAGPAGTGLETLTTQGDTLYRGASTGERLPIGSAGQVLKVVNGLPAWANESGAVTSVNGATGAVTVAAATHAAEHEAGEADEIQAMAALVDTDYLPLNGVYFHDGTTTGGRPNFFKTGTRKNTKLEYNTGNGQWKLIRNNVVEAVGVDGSNTVPWGHTWEELVTPTTVSVTQLPLETMVQKLAETGGAATATTSEDGLMSSSDKTKLNGIAAGAEVNVQANWTEADSGSDAFIQNKPSTFAPSSHSASHAAAGSDPLFDQDLNTNSVVTFQEVNLANLIFTGAGTISNFDQDASVVINSGSVRLGGNIIETYGNLAVLDVSSENSVKSATFDAQSNLTANRTYDLPDANGTLALTSDIPALGTGAGEAAEGDHTHGNLTNDGKIGSTAGLPLVTTTAGAVTTLALGTAGQVLTVNSGANGVEFAAASASGVTGAAASASDVLGVSGSNITGVDANADRIVYWNNTANKLAYGTPADAGAAEASHTHDAGDIASGVIDTDRLASGTASSGTFLRGDQTWAAVSGVTTGSVDNAVLRADGTGGSTSQSSDINIEDATTSTQNNVTISNQHSGQTNSSLVLSPKGTGAFIVGPKPDGTSTGGNARGQKAVDLSYQRAAATQVASGNYSMVLGGDRCTASSTCAIAGGEACVASSTYAIALGRSNTAQTGAACVAIGGQVNTASGGESFVMGGNTNRATGNSAATLCGDYGLSDRAGLLVQANGTFGSGTSADGTAQWIHMVLRAKTTTNSAVELLVNNARTTNGRLTCPSGKIISGIINIHGVKSDGTASAHYVRQFQVKNVGGTSSYPYTAVTVGTDYASSTSITFNDPDTNGDALSVSVTGIASETWRWTAHVSAVETTYGT